MKKSLLYLASVLAIAGCAKETLVGNEEETGMGFQIIASVDKTKTLHSEDDQEGIKTSWVAKDEIGVYAYKQSPENHYWLNHKGVADSDAEVASFTISEGYILAGAWVDYKIYTYYPFNSSIATVQHMKAEDPVGDSDPSAFPITVPASQSQTSAGDFSHLASTDFLYGYAVNQWDYNDTTGVSKKIHVNFHHALSVLEVSLTSEQSGVNVSSVTATIEDENELFSLSEASINLETGIITPVAGTPSISVNLLESATLSSTPSKVYLQITPGHAGKVLSIYASVNGQKQKIGAVKVPSSGIPVGVKAALSFKVEYSAPTNYTDLSANGTANCYLINTPGLYKFKATVKGNGVIPSQLADVVGSVDIAPKSALILWYNTAQTSNAWKNESPIVISSVKVSEDGYVTFYTPEQFISGNVVIATFLEDDCTYDSITVDENGNIDNATLLWSWNIWAVEGLDLEAEALNLEYTAANGQKTPFTVMNRNLGAIFSGDQLPASDTKGYYAAAALGNLYQWGRKDPIPHIADYENFWPIGNGNKLLTTPTYTPIVALQKTTSLSGSLDKQIFIQKQQTVPTQGNGATDESLHTFDKSSVTFAQAINNAAKYPYKYFKCAGSHTYDKHWFPNNPATDPWKYLWGDCDTDDGTALEKTLFDPCPPGWKLWQEETINAFVQNGAESASIAPGGHGLMVAGSYFGYNAGGRNEDMGESYSEPVVICGYACPIGLISGTGADRYNHQVLRYTLWNSPTSSASSSISVTVSNPNGGDAKKAGSYSVRCIKE
ncbi:MAG: hypothetical protein SPD85_06335 [Candidatus Cryptobacteroides sp.]|nr:hypothetical protein [Candidatus Cryptobacteroides sp.]